MDTMNSRLGLRPPSFPSDGPGGEVDEVENSRLQWLALAAGRTQVAGQKTLRVMLHGVVDSSFTQHAPTPAAATREQRDGSQENSCV